MVSLAGTHPKAVEGTSTSRVRTDPRPQLQEGGYEWMTFFQISRPWQWLRLSRYDVRLIFMNETELQSPSFGLRR